MGSYQKESNWYRLAQTILSPLNEYKDLIEYTEQLNKLEEKLSKYPFHDNPLSGAAAKFYSNQKF